MPGQNSQAMIDKTILLVEDDHHIQSFIAEGLRAEGYRVTVCGHGLNVARLALDQTFALIILDRMLPGMPGDDVCRQLRGQGVRTPVLMLTALDAISDKVDGFHAGADDYLTKPFAFEELVVRVEALMRRQVEYEGVADQVSVAGVTLNRKTFTATRLSVPIELTPKEFYLLEFLMVNAGQVMSKASIRHQVWGQQIDPGTNAVEVYIRHLRRKLEAVDDAPLIHTVRGFGYRFGDAEPGHDGAAHAQ